MRNDPPFRIQLVGFLAVEGEGEYARYFLMNTDHRLLRLNGKPAGAKRLNDEITVVGFLQFDDQHLPTLCLEK